MWKFCFTYIAFLPFVSLSNQTSCDHLWKYVREGNEVQGLLKQDTSPAISVYKIKLEFSVAAKLNSGYFGEILLTKNAENTVIDAIRGQPIIYRVRFPVQNPVPKLTAVYLNDRLMCTGPPAKRSDFPWLASLFYKNEFNCGGTLISQKIIVTAAYCVRDKQRLAMKNSRDSEFHIGDFNLNDLNERFINAKIENFAVYPKWNPQEVRFDGDIAIAVLSRPVEFSDNVRPLCIWQHSQTHSDLVGKKGIIAGYGITETGKVSEDLKYVDLPVVDDDTCIQKNQAFAEITSSSNFCVGDQSGNSPWLNGIQSWQSLLPSW
ncbi:hypothetical protein PVAND_009299 [Polypedilum vanderplanki]|uniref:Peptidase S1 domain-containing protein n=1 Tax=Polypedilum vanderplanki TaxID=319348 RepID=A0A9J6CCQ4_POLVA|nr:hypothetical protein PVAND_009299 [Polypedilum vanderplanki]